MNPILTRRMANQLVAAGGLAATRLDDYVAQVQARSHEPIRRVASAAGQPHWPQLAEIERSILDLVDETDGS